MLGLRLDEPLVLGELATVLDERAVSRLELLGLVRSDSDRQTLALTSPRAIPRGGVNRGPARVGQALKFLQMALTQRQTLTARQRELLAPRDRGVRRHGTARRFEAPRRARRAEGLAVDGAQRAFRARDARSAHAFPHTSAGRVPTEEGYRLHADECSRARTHARAPSRSTLSELRREIDSVSRGDDEMPRE